MTETVERETVTPRPPSRGRPSGGGKGEMGLRAALMLLGIVVPSLIGLVAAMQRSYVIAIPPASGAFSHASINWNDGERSNDGTTFRWTKDESTLNFRAARRVLPANKRLMLTMRFSGRPPGAPVTMVTLLANGRTLDSWPSNVEHPVAVDVAPLLRQHDELHLTVRVDDTYSPPRDRRDLGIALVGDARLASAPGKKLPAPDAIASVILLVLLAALAVGRRATIRWRLIAAGAMGCAITLGVLLARLPFWRIAMPLELLLGLLVVALWSREWWAALTWPIQTVKSRTSVDDRVLVIAGAVVAIAGQAIVAQHRWTFFGAALLAIGLVTLLAVFIPHSPASSPSGEGSGGGAHRTPSGQDAPSHPDPDRALPRNDTRLRTWQIAALVGIAALAVALRLSLPTTMPASLFRDEARHALKAARVLDDATYRPVYEPEISLPALFLYPLALTFKLFGVSMLTLRLFMASVGVMDVLLFFFLARRLFGTRVGLIAAYLFAVAFWALRMQRVALAPCFSTGLVLLGLLLFVRAVQLRRWWDWALAGAGAAGTIYCYHSGPFALVLMALVALVFLIRGPRRFARFWLPRFALLAVVFLVLAAPLLRYIALNFDQYLFRPRQTAIFSEENLRRLGQDQLAALQDNIRPNLGMDTVRGDREAKANLPFAPNLDAITAVFFLAGLALLLARRRYGPPSPARRFGEWLALGYLAVMLIPSMLAIDAPSTLRAFDTLPPALLIAALAADVVWARLGAPAPDLFPASGRGEHDAKRFMPAVTTKVSTEAPLPRNAGEGQGVGFVLAALTLVAIFALNAGTYFGLMRHDPVETFRFDTYFATQAGKQMTAESAAHPGTTYLVPQATIDRDVFPFFARVISPSGRLQPLEAQNPAALPARYAILLPNGKSDTPPDIVIAALPWARGLERIPGNSPTGAGGVPAFIEYRTPGQ
jgi:4-amino-4-deoxy-L-arabinose transferase-like glycosyltransferase